MQKRFGRREEIRDRLQVALACRSEGLIGSPLRDLYAERYVIPAETTVTTFWGKPMQVVLPELVSCELHRYGVIEPGLTGLFLDVVSPGTVVYDVGAHHGYYSMLAAELGARVHAFEPSRAALPLLKANLEDRAVVWSIGVWNSEGTLPLKDFGPTHSALNSFLSAKGEEVGDPKVTYAASVTTIDRHVERTGDLPNLLKIDAEGAELKVLQGAVETIHSAGPLITVEVGDTNDTSHSRDAIDFAIAHGYVPLEMAPEGTRPHQVRARYAYDNILLVPPHGAGPNDGAGSRAARDPKDLV